MRHNRDEKRFDRRVGHLRCMMANMTNSLFINGRIKTTTAKAKELRSIAEKMITLGKKGDVAAERRAVAFMRDKSVVKKLFKEISPKYKDRNGGYTRILKLGTRPGDSAHMSFIELVEESTAKKPEKKKPASKKTAKPKQAEKAA